MICVISILLHQLYHNCCNTKEWFFFLHRVTIDTHLKHFLQDLPSHACLHKIEEYLCLDFVPRCLAALIPMRFEILGIVQEGEWVGQMVKEICRQVSQELLLNILTRIFFHCSISQS